MLIILNSKKLTLAMNRKIYYIFFVLLLFLVSCRKRENFYKLKYDCENFIADYVFDTNANVFFLKGSGVSNDLEFLSGNYSLMLVGNDTYTGIFKRNLEYPKYYYFSFWKKGNSSKTYAVVNVSDTFYMSSNFVIDERDGWQRVFLSFIIPDTLNNHKFSFYIWHNSKDTVFIDDIEFGVMKFDDISLIVNRLKQNNDTNVVLINVSEADYLKLLEQRNKAIKQKLITENILTWVDAMILYKDTILNCKIRLKGDYIDHINDYRWSFRVDVRDNKYFKGMKRFSLQQSSMRADLFQWLLYNVARSEGIIAPRYDFVKVYLNNLYLGVYAYEEHFQKELIEAHKYREAPILKIDEQSLWDKVYVNYNFNKLCNNPYYNAAKINGFSDRKYFKDFRNDFLIAQNLLYQHKYQLSKPSEILNVDLFAKYYALINVFLGYHGIAWHNQRFYYNPIISKLEPIIFDNYGNLDWNIIILGDISINNVQTEGRLNTYIFLDSIFTRRYIYYLEKYSSEHYLDSIFELLRTDISEKENKIKSYKSYKFDLDLIYKNVQKIQKALPTYKKNVHKLFNQKFLPFPNARNYNVCDDTIFIKNYVYAYSQKEQNGRKFIKLMNYYPKDLYLVGYKTSSSVFETEKLLVPSYISTNDNFLLTEVGLKAKSLIVSDNKNLFEVELLPWPEPVAWSPRQELENNNKFPNEKYYRLEGKKVIFSGKQKISSIIYIPSGYEVVFEAGTEIDFVNKSGFISWSSVEINGTAKNPVIITSTDRTAKGFTVLQAPSVTINYAIFDGLDAWKYKGWELTGAVNIYESNVKITNSKFINNLCEDALNIVRSNFDVSNCYFANTSGDAFDSDFCSGIVENCVFEKTKNDAIDFSGSKIEISNCQMTNIGDKAISAGERSKLYVKNVRIEVSVIGLASKDLSLIEVKDTKVDNCTYALVILQKKPEFGPAQIVADNVTLKNNVKDFTIEKNSFLIFNGKKIEGFERNLKEKFY